MFIMCNRKGDCYMWNDAIKFVNLDGKYPDYRHTKEELRNFVKELNFKIQYLGLNKEEVVKIVDSLYRE